ncbi:hypothetical protein FH947_001897 [Enterococcus faecalis]|uniref:hypothetical protein n=1 Tax=Enterococcus faecalis TaxID=1351 RepID=UPI0019D81093|nr:hypothetical protein [Enterococcus faecalis]EGO7832329.1 hypothetical protein [Enterococcus faecalis]EGO8121899.1 hypothetical protein [Enterococcus faecalis]EKK0978276.1 hypothetical protein [Enterococcus faecalis]EKZ0164244.1 hypothetical protein [Enterococcus faecalis]EKZ0220913.1 hypothetical protein [Enterococcus faecalis]
MKKVYIIASACVINAKDSVNEDFIIYGIFTDRESAELYKLLYVKENSFEDGKYVEEFEENLQELLQIYEIEVNKLQELKIQCEYF